MKAPRTTAIATATAGLAFASFFTAMPAHATATAEEAPATGGPKNVIVLIGDGMGYNHIDNLNAYTKNQVHWQVETGPDHKVMPYGGNTKPTEGWQAWEHTGMSTHWVDGPAYDTSQAWTKFDWVKDNPTDSAAAGTAMATGVKTYNAGIGVDPNKKVVENLSERAKSLGKSAGVVSSVPFSHATPAAYSAHNQTRQDYHGIAEEQVNGNMDVVMGAGHPFFDDDNKKLATPNYKYIGADTYKKLESGDSDFTFVTNNQDFSNLTKGETPERVFGIAEVGSTLQQSRAEGKAKNEVIDLRTMTDGALNVLDNNDNGFFLMVEGGAIDWAGHANQTDRDIEEVQDFDKAVDGVIDWVETNSSWDETLVIVTADHETGYLSGKPEGKFAPMLPQGTNKAAEQSWNSGEHTNQLAPFFFKGANAADVKALATKTDTVRGSYMDNTDVAKWLLNTAWVAKDVPPSEEPTAAPTEEPTAEPTDAPTETPSEDPTETPSEQPTETPSEEQPTEKPSEDSSETPTEAPSTAPTEAPTDAPSQPEGEGGAGSEGGNQNDAQGPTTGGELANTGVNAELMWGAGIATLLVVGGVTLLVVKRARRADATK
ncbi:alkaline phosphatase [Pseudoglutamicibacter albus]|uniref:Alkaline phosphatase n=1 Tax=Pseudoglutamicibacter albus TaxID=98671 RepID=A0ABU1YXL9_9MICC|nr:alkaline phosphatase [Pseudoglutamicibacter albus]MDR7293105.1 alkaline phosphatase [Pseudoglutamicibacter albus]